MSNMKVKLLKEMYPAGTRVVVDRMYDPYNKIPEGTAGTVKWVDDIGTIHVNWDNGSSLGICPDEDEFHKAGEK